MKPNYNNSIYSDSLNYSSIEIHILYVIALLYTIVSNIIDYKY